MVFELIDLQSLGDSVLREFNEAVLNPHPDRPVAVNQAVERLIAKVEFAYGVAAKLAEREPTLEGTEAIWAKMVAICDEIALKIQGGWKNENWSADPLTTGCLTIATPPRAGDNCTRDFGGTTRSTG